MEGGEEGGEKGKMSFFGGKDRGKDKKGRKLKSTSRKVFFFFFFWQHFC